MVGQQAALDLFGSEVSTNAANFYNAGLKGRFQETKIEDDHRLTNDTYPVAKLVNGAITMVDQLLGSPGAAQDELAFKFASDIYADQTAEIERMQQILSTLPPRRP